MTTHRLSARDQDALDRPIWSALTSQHSAMALGDRLAHRYPPAIAPFAAVSDFSREAVSELRGLAAASPLALLSTDLLAPLDGLAVIARGNVRQMVLLDAISDAPDVATQVLGLADVPDMLALTALTKPGPFAAETYRLGRYIGIRDGDRLAAMAGERMRLDGFTEISAVCVHPDDRGKGYAQILMKTMMKTISESGDIPILHVFADNTGAIALYERLGFVTRAAFHLMVMKRAEATG